MFFLSFYEVLIDNSIKTNLFIRRQNFLYFRYFCILIKIKNYSNQISKKFVDLSWKKLEKNYVFSTLEKLLLLGYSDPKIITMKFMDVSEKLRYP